jgi:Tol biopolymer transport system component
MPDADVDRRLGALDGIDAPDLWDRARAMTPRQAILIVPRTLAQRIPIMAFALLVAVAGIGFAITAFRRDPNVVEQPVDGSGLIAYVEFVGGPIDRWSLFTMKPDGSSVTRIEVDLPGEANHPSWSPDGSRLAFDVQDDADTEIYVVDADGSNLLRLTSTAGWNFMPAWSPDGSKIAYVHASSSNHDIWIMDADGSNPVRLTHDADFDLHPTWSPDGRNLAFESNRSGSPEIYVMDIKGSNVSMLTNTPGFDGSPEWAPDGRGIAFVSEREGPGIYLLDVGGGGVRKVASGERVGPMEPEWSPDGARIAYTSGAERGGVAIHVVDLPSGEALALTDPGDICCPSWAARFRETPTNLKGLVVLQRNDRAWTFEAGATTSLGGVEPWDVDPSGKIVAFRTDQIWYGAPGTTNSVSLTRRDAVLLIDPLTKESVVLDRVAPNQTFNGPARLSPDGKTIALRVVSYPAPLRDGHPGAEGTSEVCLVSMAGGSRKCFPNAGDRASLDWSADGRTLLLAGLGGPISTLDIRTGALGQLVDPSGGKDARRLLEEAGSAPKSVTLTQASWSRSGRYIAADAAVVPGGSVPIIYTGDGHAVALGSPSGDAMAMAWSPAEDVLAYAVAEGSLATGGPRSVHILDPTSGDRRVVDLSATRVGGVIGLTWSPDAELLALQTFEGTWVLDPEAGAGSLQRLDIPGAVVAWR